MNSPEIAEHFVLWLFAEVERLIQVGSATGSVMNTVNTVSVNDTVTAINNAIPSAATVSTTVDDVNMSSGNPRLQGTRNFSKALESAVSISNNNNNNRRTFSEVRDRSDRAMPVDTRDRPSENRRTTLKRELRESTTRRVIRSETGGKIQKIKLAVDFDQEEAASRSASAVRRHKNTFKKISTEGTEDTGTTTAPRVKCQYWPNCRAGESCPNIHPSETCKHFPNCTFGDACTFVHPSIPCKFQEMCQNPLCNYQHRPSGMSGMFIPSSASTGGTSTIQCKFYPRCVNVNCTYLHPVKVQCRFGVDCSRADCPFEHPSGRKGAHLKSVVFAPCKYGKQCARADCPYQHEMSAETAVNNAESSVTTDQQQPADQQMIQ